MILKSAHTCKMTLFILGYLLPLVWPLPARSQSPDFLVDNICNPLEQKKETLQRNPYSLVGCNMTMACGYSRDKICRQRPTVVRCDSQQNCTADMKNVVLREDTRTNCGVLVEFINMTVDMQGTYRCIDTDYVDENGAATNFRERKVKVGYSSSGIPPQNIQLVYQPRRLIGVVLSLGNNSVESIDGNSWIIKYKWSEKYQPMGTRCDERCNNLLGPDCHCEPCVAKCIYLKSYVGHGQYNGFGNIVNDILVRIDVESLFGVNNFFQTSYKLLEWVRPDSIKNVSQIGENASSIQLRLTLPRSLDTFHFRYMNNCFLKISYSWRMPTVQNQSLRDQENKRFYDQYGFVRNLEDDMLAFQRKSYSVSSPAKVLCWNSQKYKRIEEMKTMSSPVVEPINIWIEGLPLPGFSYNLAVSLTARYTSDPVFETVRTAETVPMKGPELQDSFLFCPTDRSFVKDTCWKCLVYFKEIPLVWRGGTIRNYSLTLESVDGSNTCGWGKRSFWVDGNNTFYLPGLASGGTYNISLTGYNAIGRSPATVRSLSVRSKESDLWGPRFLVVEKGHNLFKLSWADGPEKQNGTYFVHYCNGSRFGSQGFYIDSRSTEAELWFKCVTNMVTMPVPADNANSFTFHFHAAMDGDLRPIFFVSMLRSDGQSSGLVGADCFFTEDKSPGEAGNLRIEQSDTDPSALVVAFFLPCGTSLDFGYGRPDHFYIDKTKMDAKVKNEFAKKRCTEECRKWTTNEGSKRFWIENNNFKQDIVHLLSNLEEDATYCVGVKIGQEWNCQTGRTKSADSNILPLVLGTSLSFLTIIIAALLIWCIRACRKRYIIVKRKFTKHLACPAMDVPFSAWELRKEHNEPFEVSDDSYESKHKGLQDLWHTLPSNASMCLTKTESNFKVGTSESLSLVSRDRSTSTSSACDSDAKSLGSAYTDEERETEDEEGPMPVSRYSGQQCHQAKQQEVAQRPSNRYSGQPSIQHKEEIEDDDEKENDEDVEVQRPYSRYKCQELRQDKHEETEPRQAHVCRYSGQPSQQEQVTEDSEEKEEQRMPINRYASQLSNPNSALHPGPSDQISTLVDGNRFPQRSDLHDFGVANSRHDIRDVPKKNRNKMTPNKDTEVLMTDINFTNSNKPMKSCAHRDVNELGVCLMAGMDRQGAAAFLLTALNGSTKPTASPGQLCGDFSLPLSVTCINERTPINIKTGKLKGSPSPRKPGIQPASRESCINPAFRVQRNLSSTDDDDILKAAASHPTAFPFPNSAHGDRNAHGRSERASIEADDEKTRDQSDVHMHDHVTQTLSACLKVDAVSSEINGLPVLENYSVLPVRDTRNRNGGDSETEIEDILEAATGEIQSLLPHKARGILSFTQVPNDNPFVLDKLGGADKKSFSGKDVPFVKRDNTRGQSSEKVDPRSKLSQDNSKICSSKLFNTSDNENDVDIILLSAKGHKSPIPSFEYPPKPNTIREDVIINIHKGTGSPRHTANTVNSEPSLVTPPDQTKLGTNRLKPFEKSGQLSALSLNLTDCEPTIVARYIETYKTGVFKSTKNAHLPKTTLTHDWDGSLEDILSAAEASNLPKTDLLCTPMDWPTNRQSRRTDSCSEQDSQYCTSGVECESDCESAKESSDSSTEESD